MPKHNHRPARVRPPRKSNTLKEWIIPLREETAYSIGRSVASIMFILGLIAWAVSVLFIARRFFGGGTYNEIELFSDFVAALMILPITVSYFLSIAIFDLCDCAIERRGKTPEEHE